MKRLKITGCRSLFLIILIFNFYSAVFGWGRIGHYYINFQAVNSVPDEMAAFRQYAAWIASHASDPDKWKGYLDDERYRHYIDLDLYGEYPFKNVTRNLDELIKENGRKKVRNNGLLPWTIKNKFNRFIYLMKLGEWEKAFYVAAALGHYVGDAHQPFHSTGNFDGQNTDNAGIHSRYESLMVMKYQDEIKSPHSTPLSAQAITQIPVIEDLAFGYVIDGYQYVEKIIAADNKYKNLLTADEEKYYRMLWKDTGHFTAGLINRAAENLSYLYYVAWIEAGKPAIPSIDPSELTNVKNQRMWREIFYDDLNDSGVTSQEIYGNPLEQSAGNPDYIAHPPVIP